MAMGSGVLDELVAIFCKRNASPPANGKFLSAAAFQSALASPVVAEQKRRLFGSRENTAQQDVLLTADVDTVAEEESDYEAGTAHRKDKKGKQKKQQRTGNGRKQNKDAGRTLNGVNSRTGRRDRCYECNVERQYAPQCPRRGNHSEGPLLYQRGPQRSSSQPFPPVSMGSPIQAQPMNSGRSGRADCRCEHSVSTTLRSLGRISLRTRR